jgi:hypothetical protein
MGLRRNARTVHRPPGRAAVPVDHRTSKGGLLDDATALTILKVRWPPR